MSRPAVPSVKDSGDSLSNANLVIGVLALQGAFAAHRTVLESVGVQVVLVRSVEDVESLDGLILPGGESTTMSNLLTSTGLFEPLQSRVRAGLPVFGTCAGMILLAKKIVDGRTDQKSLQVMDITVRRNAYGRQVDSFETELAVDGFDAPLPAVFIRAPAIESCGVDVRVFASVGGSPCLVEQGNALAVSFHPELTDDRRVHEHFLEIVRAAKLVGLQRSSVGNTVTSATIQE